MKVQVAVDPAIGKRIHEIRIELGETLEQFSVRMEVTSRFLSMVEKGEKNLSSYTLGKLCESVSVSADYILFGKKAETDVGLISEMLSNLDQRYVENAVSILRNYILSIKQAESNN